MTNRSQQPWSSGPAEILVHGLTLLSKDTGINRRLALIAIDNAVELSIKTYLSLPKRVTHLSIPRKRLEEISESFPSLLDALEEFAVDKLQGVDLASIEWYHRLRNQLYHQGYGLSIDREKVEVYAELARALFKNLFGTSVLAKRGEDAEILGRFMQLWLRLENALGDRASENSLLGRRQRTVLDSVRFLKQASAIPEYHAKEIEQLRKLRNEVVHGVVDYKEVLTPDIVDRLERLVYLMGGADEEERS